MAESPYHQMSVQHIRHLYQSRSLYPPALIHQLPIPGDHNPWAAEAALEAHLRLEQLRSRHQL